MRLREIIALVRIYRALKGQKEPGPPVTYPNNPPAARKQGAKTMAQDTGRIFNAVVNAAIAAAPPSMKQQTISGNATVAKEVVEAVNNNPKITIAPVVPGWQSPTNIAMVVGFIATLVANWGISIPPEVQGSITTVIVAGLAIFVWWRKRTSAAVTPSAAAKLVEDMTATKSSP